MRSYFSTLSNWGRWGADDQRGTLNLITPERVREAAALIREGVPVSCARTITPRPSPLDRMTPLHFMISSSEGGPAEGFGGSTDWFGFACHGHSMTHLDAPSHVCWNGKLYNGHDARRVTAARGAEVGSVEAADAGVLARGLLVDIPRFRGGRRLSGPEAITSDELAGCLRSEGLDARPGDVLLVRTGRDVPSSPGDAPDTASSHPGLHVECAPWVRRHDISVLVSDVAQEVQPSGYAGLVFPLHAVGIVALGLWLVDNAFLEDLAAACAARGRWEFAFSLAPLRLKNATASPVNPIAIL